MQLAEGSKFFKNVCSSYKHLDHLEAIFLPLEEFNYLESLLRAKKPSPAISSFLHSYRNWEATRMSLSRWIDKLCYIWTKKNYSALNKWATKSWKGMEKSSKYITKKMKPSLKCHMLYGFNYMTIWKRQTMETNIYIYISMLSRS